jgi:mannose-6-phosphate isomerase-like protein (cupin superfamily)
MRSATSCLLASAALLCLCCADERHGGYVHISPDTLPSASYERPPERSFARSDYVIKLEQMTAFYDVPGEAGYFIDGDDYGFEAISIIMTETHPHGGPPLHTHDTEEAHIVYHGRLEYIIGDRRFTVDGPYIARVPAGVPHTFINAGAEPLNLTAVFPSKRLDYKEVGPNPLVPSKDAR